MPLSEKEIVLAPAAGDGDGGGDPCYGKSSLGPGSGLWGGRTPATGGAPAGQQGGGNNNYSSGPESVELRFPVSLLQLIEQFGSRFFVYDSQTRAYVGNPGVAPQICRLIADGNETAGQELQRKVEQAYAEYIAVPSSALRASPKPIP